MEDAIDRLVASGDLDSILVQGPDGVPRRLFSEASVSRFLCDSAIDPEAVKRAAKAMADATVAEAIRDLQAEIEELRGTQGVVVQQMKDMLLLEIRNLKEQDRDLTSFVYELTEEIKARMPKKRR
jgi:FtsZ-binding cell division protein ZapB